MSKSRIKELLEKNLGRMFVLDREFFPLINNLLNEHHHYLTIVSNPKDAELVVKVTKDVQNN